MDVRDLLRGPRDVSALRTECDLTLYTPSADAPAWLRAWSTMACEDAGALTMVGPGGVHVSQDGGEKYRLQVDQPLFLLCGLLGRARLREARIAMACPPGARHIPLLMATASVLAQALENAQQSSSRRTGPVLVISQDLDLRRCYVDVLVGRGVSAMPLNDVYPGSRLLADGKREALESAAVAGSAEGVCFFLPGLSLPRSLGFAPRQVIADLRFTVWQRRLPELIPWVARVGKSVVALYTLGDVAGREALTKAGFLDFPLDHFAIRVCRLHHPQVVASVRESPIDTELSGSDRDLERKHRILPVPDSEEVENLLVGLRDLLASCPEDLPDVQRAKWLTALLTHLPTPLSWYEAASYDLGRSTLKHLIERLGYRVDGVRSVGPVLQTARVQLLNLYDLLGASNPLASSTAQCITAAMGPDRKGRTLVLVRDRVVARAVEGWLDLEVFKDGAPHSSEVRSCNDFRRCDGSYAAVVAVGSFPRRYRWLAGAKLAPDVRFVAYGFEWDTIERQLTAFYSPEGAARNAEAMARSLVQLGCSVPVVPSAPVSFITLSLERPPAAAARHRDKRPAAAKGLAGLANLLEKVAAERTKAEAGESEDVFGEEPPATSVPGSPEEKDRDGVFCIVVRVKSRWQGEGSIAIGLATPVDCFVGANAETVDRCEPKDLRPGYTLIRIDEEGRVGLFDRITELAERQPAMQNVGVFRRAWQSALARLAGRYRSDHTLAYARILEDLRAEGATIETEIAIRIWMKDLVIGPQTLATIRAVGRLAGITALDRNADQFDAAFRKVRSLHQALGKRLAYAIRRSMTTDTRSVRSRTDFDAHLALPLDELVESADLCEVLAIEQGSVVVAPHLVGRFVAKR